MEIGIEISNSEIDNLVSRNQILESKIRYRETKVWNRYLGFQPVSSVIDGFCLGRSVLTRRSKHRGWQAWSTAVIARTGRRGWVVYSHKPLSPGSTCSVSQYYQTCHSLTHIPTPTRPHIHKISVVISAIEIRQSDMAGKKQQPEAHSYLFCRPVDAERRERFHHLNRVQHHHRKQQGKRQPVALRC